MSIPDTLFEVILQDERRFHTGDKGSIVSWSHDSDYLTATDEWSASFRTTGPADRKLLPMAPVELSVDNRPRMVGRIDGVVKGRKPGIVELRGRDYLADVTENGADPTLHVKVGDKLDQAILNALKPSGIFGFEDPEVKMERRTGAPVKKTPKLVAADLKQTKVHPGDAAFEWSNRLAARHGYTIQPATVRTKVCLEVPNYLQAPIGQIIRKDGARTGTNVIEGYADEDYSSLPTFATMVGTSGTPTEKLGRTKFDWDLWAMFETMPKSLRDNFNRWTVSGRRVPATCTELVAAQLYRFLYFEDKHATTPAQIIESVWRTVSEQLRKTLTYNCKLRGTRDPRTGYTYAVNTIMSVDDDDADVHEDLWVSSCKMEATGGSGAVTALKLWRPWTFQIGKGGHGNG